MESKPGLWFNGNHNKHTLSLFVQHVVWFIHAFLYGFSSILQEFQCICSVLNADISGLNSAASAVPRYTLVGVSDLSDQILRLIFYLNNHCKLQDSAFNFPFFLVLFLFVHWDWCVSPCLVISGFPVCQLKMQEVLPQPLEAFKAYLDSYVQKTT